MFTLSRRLFVLALLCVPVVASAQNKTIRELTDLTPVVGDAMETETAANESGFVLISEILALIPLPSGSDGDSTTVQSDSGLEIVASVLTLLRGCADNEILKWDETQDDWNCEADSGGADTNAVKEFNYPASSLRGGMAPDDSFPAALHDEGTNIDIDTLGFDDTTDECAGGQLTAPSDIDTSGTVTFRAVWYSGTATTGDVLWDIRHSTGQAEGASWDTALTIELATADTTQGTVDLLTVTTWTETVSNLLWVASDTVTFLLCRDVSGDDMVGDAALLQFVVEVPRS